MDFSLEFFVAGCNRDNFSQHLSAFSNHSYYAFEHTQAEIYVEKIVLLDEDTRNRIVYMHFLQPASQLLFMLIKNRDEDTSVAANLRHHPNSSNTLTKRELDMPKRVRHEPGGMLT